MHKILLLDISQSKIYLWSSTISPRSKNFTKRGVAPVIATLLLVAIAVVGGTIIFTFTEGFFSSAQISGSTVVESLTILGYDARTVS